MESSVYYTTFNWTYRDYRVAVNFQDLELALKISKKEIIDWLDLYNYSHHTFDLVKSAKSCLGILHRYEFSTKPGNMPIVTDAASFIQWVFAVNGLKLPNNTAGQLTQMLQWHKNAGLPEKTIQDLTSGDLIFADDTGDGKEVCQVGIVTENSEVIHCQGMIEPPEICTVPLLGSQFETHFQGAFAIPDALNLMVISNREDFSDSTWISEVVKFALRHAVHKAA